MSSFLTDEQRDGLAERLRRESRVDYLHVLLLPAALRDTLLTLRTFHLEIRSIPPRVSEAPLGEIRLQWWADGVLGLRSGEVGSNPVGAALLAYLDRAEYARPILAAKVEAHSADLYKDALGARDDFERYAGQTRSVLWQLLATELDGEGAPHFCGHLGVAETVTDHLDGDVEAAEYGLSHIARAGAAPGAKLGGRLRIIERTLLNARDRPGVAPVPGALRTQWLLWRG